MAMNPTSHYRRKARELLDGATYMGERKEPYAIEATQLVAMKVREEMVDYNELMNYILRSKAAMVATHAATCMA